MTSYEQHMKHFQNHRKDRFYQQCSGPVKEPKKALTPEQMEDMERRSFLSLIENTKEEEFPIFIRQVSGGVWLTTGERDCFGERIDSRDDLTNFYRKYVDRE